MDEKLIGIKEVSDFTGLPRFWLYLATSTGNIPHLKIGKYLKFRLSEIEAWLDLHRRGPGAGHGGGGNGKR